MRNYTTMAKSIAGQCCVSPIRVTRMASAACLAAIGLSACATAPSNTVNEVALARLQTLEGTGETRTCLPSGTNNRFEAVDNNRVLVRTGVSNYYLSRTSGDCSKGSRFANRFQFVVRGGNICANQIVNIVDNNSGIIVGACSLGPFERMRRKKAVAEDEATSFEE
ncbi:MAG: DUF6491 family protein [Pseudomonadota bacterium]